MGPTATNEEQVFESLRRLKREGSSLLVVGPPNGDLRRAASRRLLGDASAGPRRRAYVLTGEHRVDPAVSNGLTNDRTVRVVEHTPLTRSTATTPASESTATAGTTAPSTAASGASRRTVAAGSPSQLSWAVGEEINELERLADGFSPGELRICLDSLSTLVEAHGADEADRFLRMLRRRVRSVGGMAHSHLYAPLDDPLVTRLSPAFDAIIELRAVDAGFEQRWRLLDRNLDSGWLVL